jgi:hypothetical protein
MTAEGELLRSRIVTDLTPVLEDALDRRLDGYAVLAPRDALLGDATDRGVLTFEDGVPTLAYHAGTDRGGPPALADVGPGPYRVELYAVGDGTLDVLDGAGATELRVPPGMPAERLSGDGALAERTRAASTSDHADDGRDALEAFLADEEGIAQIRESARTEAERRAEEWGFEDAID